MKVNLQGSETSNKSILAMAQGTSDKYKMAWKMEWACFLSMIIQSIWEIGSVIIIMELEHISTQMDKDFKAS